MSFLILVVDDEPDVELLFRQQFRRDLRDGRFAKSKTPRSGSSYGIGFGICSFTRFPCRIPWLFWLFRTR